MTTHGLPPTADNLYWGTYSDNQLDRVVTGIHSFAMRDSCSRGHKYADGDYLVYNGARHCLTCRSIYGKPRREAGVNELPIDLSQESA